MRALRRAQMDGGAVLDHGLNEARLACASLQRRRSYLCLCFFIYFIKSLECIAKAQHASVSVRRQNAL